MNGLHSLFAWHVSKIDSGGRYKTVNSNWALVFVDWALVRIRIAF